MRSLLFAALGMLALTYTASAQTSSAPITTAVDGEEGEYLVSGSGYALYMFKADTQGTASRKASSVCEGDCLSAWPALVVTEPPIGDDKVRLDLLGTMERTDGSLQVTYNGWPLYYYAEDFQPGDIKGNDIDDFGGDWYLLGADGNRSDRDDDNEAEDD